MYTIISFSIYTFVAEEIEEVDVLIGETHSSGDFLANGYTLCGHQTNISNPGDVASITCSTPTQGRYVAVTAPGPVLTLCEVEIYSTDGNHTMH